MLRQISIDRFKSIRSLELDFGQVNLFIGGNGTGKSNILEAIGILSACLDRGLRDDDIAKKGVRLTPPEIMKSSFKNSELPKTLELMGKFDNGLTYKAILSGSASEPNMRIFSEAGKLHGELLLGRSNRGARAAGVPHPERLDPFRGIWDQVKATYVVPEEMSNELEEFSRYAIYTPQTDVLRGKERGRTSIEPVGLLGEGLPDAVSGLLKQLHENRRKSDRKSSTELQNRMTQLLVDTVDLVWLPGWANKVKVDRLDSHLTSRDLIDRASKMVYFVDQYMHEKRNTLSVYDSSEGTLFLLFVSILLVYYRSPKCFALDNVDNALNPKLTRKLISQIIKVTHESNENQYAFGARQVFMTSHNPTSLDAFDIFNDDQRVFVVSRDEKGQTIAKRLEPPKGMTLEEWNIARGGRNLSQLWLDNDIKGALGV